MSAIVSSSARWVFVFCALSLFDRGSTPIVSFSHEIGFQREKERGRRGRREKKEVEKGLFLNRARSCVDLNRKPRAWWFLVNLFYAWSANERRGRVFLFEYPIVGIFKKEWERENSTESLSLSLSNRGRREKCKYVSLSSFCFKSWSFWVAVAVNWRLFSYKKIIKN